MATSYPTSIVSFPTWTDGVSVDYAENINNIQNEVQAVESTLGINPTSGSGSSTVTTVAQYLAYITANKSPISHAHTHLGPLTAGNLVGSYLSFSGSSLQAYSPDTSQFPGVPSSIGIQNIGGDTHIGNTQGSTTFYGLVTATNGLDAPNINATGTISTSNLSVGGATLGSTYAHDIQAGEVSSDGNVTLNNPSTSFVVANGDTITDRNPLYSFPMPGLVTNTQWGSSGGTSLTATQNQTVSRKEVNGQLFVCKNRYGGDDTYLNGVATFTRVNEQSSRITLLGLANGQGSATTGFSLAYHQSTLNLGISIYDLANDYSPISASNFITSSSLRFKVDIESLPRGALARVTQLRGISYRRRPRSVVHAGRTLGPGHPQYEGTKALNPLSEGDKKKQSVKEHGLVAEEVAQILPEAVHYDGEGNAEGIDYAALVPHLIEAVKELAAEVVTLRREVGLP